MNENRKQTIKKLVVTLLPAAITFAVNMFAYMVPKQIVSPARYVFLDMEIDRLIPFVPCFIVVYYGAFAQWFNYFLQVSFGDRKLRDRYFGADIMSKIIIFIIFMSWPLAVARPTVDGSDGFWHCMTSFTFFVDNPLGAFPSIHCFYSWMAVRYSFEAEPAERKWISWLQLLFSLLVFASTVLVKQHYFIDVPGGIIFAEAALWIAGHTGLADAAGRMFDKISNAVNSKWHM
ncbi:MAG: phosphatase PAP2 family protein [Erysipelotrichaceae bacterium]|nr:phosphatase PAP2 family protein [Erysipelotrichaceae bacterium]